MEKVKKAVGKGAANMIPLSTLKKNPDNPRSIRGEKFERLKRSLQTFPQMMALRPIVTDAQSVVLGGNMRLEALKALGYKELPAEWVKRADELTDEQRREFVVKDNSGFGEWDWDALANGWDDLPLTEWGLDVPEVPASDEWGDALGGLPTGDKAPFQQMTFTVSDEQAEQIKAAIEKAKRMGAFVDTGNENSNGNALARICETFNGRG